MKQIFLPVVLVLFFFTGCTCSQKSDDIPGYMASAGSQAIEVTAGSPVVIELKAQLGTGYSWKLATPLAPGITLAEESIKSLPDSKPGAEEIQVFRFNVKKGEYTLTFRYGEHWKNNPVYKETSIIKITAK